MWMAPNCDSAVTGMIRRELTKGPSAQIIVRHSILIFLYIAIHSLTYTDDMRWSSVLSCALLVTGASASPKHTHKKPTVSPSASSSVAVSTPSTAPIKAATDPPYWLANIKHQGNAPFAASGYAVFRNVKDYGAVG
jgi:hypothetical protein